MKIQGKLKRLIITAYFESDIDTSIKELGIDQMIYTFHKVALPWLNNAENEAKYSFDKNQILKDISDSHIKTFVKWLFKEQFNISVTGA